MTVTPAAPALAGRLHARAARAAGARPALRRRGPDPHEEQAERAGGHIPEELKQRIKREADRRAAQRRAARARVRRAGLVEDRVGARRGAARPLDQRALLAHARTPTTCWPAARPSRSTATCARRCAASCTTPTRSPRPRPAPTRRGSRPRRGATDAGWRIDGEKWFVTNGDVADGLHRDGERLVDGRELPDAVPGRPRRARHRDRRRPALHPQLSARAPDDPLHRRRGGRGRGGRRPRRRRRPAARLVHRGAARASPRAASARCGGCSRRPSPGRSSASRAAAGSATTRASRSRSPTRPPTPRPAGC